LQKSRGSTPAERAVWREGVYDQIEEMMPLQSRLSIERMSQLAEVSRAGFYRHLQDRAPAQEDMEVRSTIQAIAVEHRRRYGYQTHHGGVTPSRDARESQAGRPDDA